MKKWLRVFKKFPWITYEEKEFSKLVIEKAQFQRFLVEKLKYRPMVSLMVRGIEGLEKLKLSLEAQSYPNWEIILADEKGDIDQANGEWIGFLNSTDVLSPQALFFLIRHLQQDPDLEKINCYSAFCNKDQSRVLEIYQNTGNHFYLIKKEKIGQSDLKTKNECSILHYTSNSLFQKTNLEHCFETEHPIPLVSIVICFKDKLEITLQAIQSLLSQSYSNWELILVNNQSSAENVHTVSCFLSQQQVTHQILDYDRPFNFSHMNDWVIREKSKGELILLMNNDVVLTDPDSILKMAQLANRKEIGTVGTQLKYPNGKIQHGGVTLESLPSGREVLAHLTDSDLLSHCDREVFASTFALTMFKRGTYLKTKGLNFLFYPNAFSDIAFNFDCIRLGLKNIYLGTLSAIHQESISRGANYEKWEWKNFQMEYADILWLMRYSDSKIAKVHISFIKRNSYYLKNLILRLALAKPILSNFLFKFSRMNKILTHHT